MGRFSLEGCSLPFLVQIRQTTVLLVSFKSQTERHSWLVSCHFTRWQWSLAWTVVMGMTSSCTKPHIWFMSRQVCGVISLCSWETPMFKWWMSKSSRTQSLPWQAVLPNLLGIQMCSVKYSMHWRQGARFYLMWLWIASWLNLWWQL